VQDAVYPVSWRNISTIYEPHTALPIKDKTIGIHWFGGSKISLGYEATVTSKNIDQYADVELFKRMKEMYAQV